MAGLEDRERLLTHPKTKKMTLEKYLWRHGLSIQQALAEGELDAGNGLTKVRSGVVPLSRLLESGHVNPGSLRPQKGGLEGASGAKQLWELKLACAHSGQGWLAGDLKGLNQVAGL